MTLFTACIGLVAMGLVFYFMERMATPTLNPQEPPLLKPRVPLIGHIVGLFKHEADYFSILRTRTNQSAVTMPMLNSKNYLIFSPFLAQQAMRARSLDFDLVGLAFAKSVGSISEQAMAERIKKGPTTYTSDTVAAIKSSLTGEGLRRMNIAMLDYVSSSLNDIGSQEGLQVPSLWLWMRDMMTMATVEAFYGHANPFRADPDGLAALWEFDDALPAMLFMPPALAKRGARCRDRMVRTLRPYFDANLHRNDDVSAFVASRTEASIKHNVLGDDLCKGEVINIWVSTANSIPALFWTLTNVCLRPDLVAKLREEIGPFVSMSTDKGQKKATLDIRAVEKQCSLLLSCQREGVRFANHMVARRAVTEDTVLTEEDGRSYLLKQGTDVMWSAKVAHEIAEVWGTDSAEFNPDRFMRETTKEVERKQRAAYMPFGGGAHLCPGRNFAFAEILGLIGALVVGYEIQGLKAENIKMGTRALASAIPKPTDDGDGGFVTLRRREGWEDVNWGFGC